ncbi:MAG TPA: 3D domain-containing protein [Gemmatimonadaceae bacterium]|nr:3D domain-containing protein [Gemmatimonadaceae bacterium]
MRERRRLLRRKAAARRLARRLLPVRPVALSLVLLLALVAGTMARPVHPPTPLAIAPIVVRSPLKLPAVYIHAALPKPRSAPAPRPEWKPGMGVAPAGLTVPVSLTAYCLKGTTRRGRYVRPGIVAADPNVFPLARYLEIYIGKRYVGRFLIDDTGGAIKGAKIDIWTPTCREAVLFGRRKGIAVLVPRGAPSDTGPMPDVANLMTYVRRR